MPQGGPGLAGPSGPARVSRQAGVLGPRGPSRGNHCAIYDIYPLTELANESLTELVNESLTESVNESLTKSELVHVPNWLIKFKQHLSLIHI